MQSASLFEPLAREQHSKVINAFHDFPYLPPIEASAYYAALDAAKLYPLPETTMASPNSVEYLYGSAECKKGRPPMVTPAVLLTSVEGLAPIFPIAEVDELGGMLPSSSYVTISHSSAPRITERVRSAERTQAAPEIRCISAVGGGEGMHKIFEEVVVALNESFIGADTKDVGREEKGGAPAPPAAPVVIVIEHVMSAAIFGSSEEQLALSLALFGIASLIHAYHGAASSTQTRRRNVFVVFALGCSSTSVLGSLVSGKLQLYFDLVRIPPALDADSRLAAGQSPPLQGGLSRPPHFFSTNIIHEEVAGAVQDIHESLCERIEDGEFKSDSLPLVVVVADSKTGVNALRAACLARYSPIAMQFAVGLPPASVEAFHPANGAVFSSASFPSQNAPLIVLLTCAEFLHGLHVANLPGGASSRIAAVVHCGTSAAGNLLSQEHLDTLRNPWGARFRVPPCVEQNAVITPSLCKTAAEEIDCSFEAFATTQMGQILLGFLRPFGNTTSQRLNLNLLPAIFPLDGAQPTVRNGVKHALAYLAQAKCIDIGQDDARAGSVFHVRLLPFGRLASRRSRFSLQLCRAQRPNPPLVLEALRIVIWGALFRLTRQEIEEVVQNLYSSLRTVFVLHEAAEELAKATVAALLEQYPELARFGQGAVHRSLRRLALGLGSWPVVCPPSAALMEGIPLGRAEVALSVPAGKRHKFDPPASKRPVTTCRGWWGTAPAELDKVLVQAPPAPALNYPTVRDLCVLATSGGCDDLSRCAAHVATLPTLMSDALLATRIALHTAFTNACVLLEGAGCQTTTTAKNESDKEEINRLAEAVVVPQLPVILLSSPSFLTFADPAVSTTVQDGHGFVANSGAWLDFYTTHSTGPVGFDTSLVSLARQGVSLLELCKHKVFGNQLQRDRSGDECELSNDDQSPSGRSKKARLEASATNAKKKVEPVFTGAAPLGKEKQIIDEFVTVCGKIGREQAEGKYNGKKGFAFLATSHAMFPYYDFCVTHKKSTT